MREIADDWRHRVPHVRVVGMVGPRGDGYLASDADPDEAAAYHLPQVRSLADGGADLITAYTLTGIGEAAGVAFAAREVGLPVGIGFTVEADGRLPDGTPLADAIAAVDAVCPPTHDAVNCAHPRTSSPVWPTRRRSCSASRWCGRTRPHSATPSSTRPTSSTTVTRWRWRPP